VPTQSDRDKIRAHLAAEVGRIDKEAPFTVALAYPSPYAAGMSSLGFQRIYRAIMEERGMACERAFLDDAAERDLSAQTRPLTYESLRPLDAFPVVAASVAYELEIGGLVRMLEAAGIPALRAERDERHPFVLAGGPLTFSNPLPLADIADAVVIGEGEAITVEVLRALEANATRTAQTDALARIPHVFVGALHGAMLPEVAKVDNVLLPAFSQITTPHAHLSNMFLIETERGCSRACTYCVMRRSTNGGMRVVPMDTILSRVPSEARRVGLVGAAVSDHPKVAQIVGALAESGREVGLSSVTSGPAERRSRLRLEARRRSHPHHRHGRRERAAARVAREKGACSSPAQVRRAHEEARARSLEALPDGGAAG
jgi:hypothetical protein